MTNIAREQEVWKQYPDYDFIEVSNLGRVRTKDRYVTRNDGRKLHIKGRVLKQSYSRNGYMKISFHANGKPVYLRVHRMVAICFIPNPNGYPEVNHKDNDRTNNIVSNLEWCTKKYNEAYKKNFGTSQAEVQGRPVIAINIETSEVFWFKTQTEAARQLGGDVRIVNSVVKDKSHKTCGCWFTYADKAAVEKTRAKFGDGVARKVEELMNNKL